MNARLAMTQEEIEAEENPPYAVGTLLVGGRTSDVPGEVGIVVGAYWEPQFRQWRYVLVIRDRSLALISEEQAEPFGGELLAPDIRDIGGRNILAGFRMELRREGGVA